MRLSSLFLLLALVCGPLLADPSADDPPSPSDGPPDAAPVSDETASGEQVPAAPVQADLTAANDLLREKRYAEAEQLLAEQQATFPDDPSLLLMRGELLLALNRPADALPLLQHAAEIDPDRERVSFQLGTAMLATGDREAALEAFGHEIDLSQDPQVLVLAHLNRSMILQRDKKWDESAGELEAVLALQPDKVEVWGDLASMRMQSGELDLAAEALAAGRRAGFESAQHFYSLGARLYREKRFEDAEKALRTAIEIDPRLAAAEKSLAATLEQQGRASEAIRHLERYLELAPDASDKDKIEERIRQAKG